MKALSLSAAAAVAVLVGAVQAQQTQFLTAIDDVPLPAALQERGESLAEFDGPEGRIVSVQAAGVIEPGALTGFYDQSLPALGWTRDGAVFVRGRARLAITFKRDGAGLLVTFRLVERPASLRLD
jgi:hypothetical protein